MFTTEDTENTELENRGITQTIVAAALCVHRTSGRRRSAEQPNTADLDRVGACEASPKAKAFSLSLSLSLRLWIEACVSLAPLLLQPTGCRGEAAL